MGDRVYTIEGQVMMAMSIILMAIQLYLPLINSDQVNFTTITII